MNDSFEMPDPDQNRRKEPTVTPVVKRFMWCGATVLLVLCSLPLILLLFGVDFSSAGAALTPESVEGLTTGELGEAAHLALRGSFTHTLLEWSAVCTAVFVGLLAFVQYRQTGESSLPIIGVALLCAGAMDAFHTLAADRLIEAAASNSDLIPFTWAICRMFNGAIQLIGVGIFVVWAKRQVNLSTVRIAAISAGFMIIAYVVVHYSATSGSLPQTMFPDAVVKRPFDLFPLIPYVLCGLVVFPLYMRRHPTLFAASLLLSIIPQVATQLYMAFGSIALHDAAFNIAHGLKAVCYLVPMAGLLAQYIQTHTENKRAEARLREYSDALEEGSDALEDATCMAEAAAKAKAEFLANMSHEIRTPMTAILGYADILAHDLKEQHHIDAIEVVRRNGTHLLALINDILDLSKLDAGQMTVEQIDCSLSQLLLDVETLMKVKADAKGLSLCIEQIGSVPKSVLTDPTRIRQVLINLTGNAIKFTETGEVRITLRMIDPSNTQNPCAEFMVKDSGIGMTKEQMATIFEPFQQADTSTNRKFGGTGLGLSISARLIELLGGTLNVESSPGEGSCFAIAIPVGSTEGAELVDDLNAAKEAATKHVQSQRASELVSQLNARILLAEDGPDNQRLISFHLKKAGATVEIAENGLIAHDRAMEERKNGTPFDVILMDMQMPVMDGYAATRLLRDEGYNGPIIALTAHAMASDRQKCIDAGCDDHATKPIDRAALFETIRVQLRRGDAERSGQTSVSDSVVQS